MLPNAQLFVSVKCTTLLVFGALRFSHLQVHFRLSQIHLQLLLLFLQALQFGAEFCAPVRGTKVKIKLEKSHENRMQIPDFFALHFFEGRRNLSFGLSVEVCNF